MTVLFLEACSLHMKMFTIAVSFLFCILLNFRVEIKASIRFLSPYNIENREHGRKDGYEETRTEKMNTQVN
jgi:hypothetical protein